MGKRVLRCLPHEGIVLRLPAPELLHLLLQILAADLQRYHPIAHLPSSLVVLLLVSSQLLHCRLQLSHQCLRCLAFAQLCLLLRAQVLQLSGSILDHALVVVFEPPPLRLQL